MRQWYKHIDNYHLYIESYDIIVRWKCFGGNSKVNEICCRLLGATRSSIWAVCKCWAHRACCQCREAGRLPTRAPELPLLPELITQPRRTPQPLPVSICDADRTYSTFPWCHIQFSDYNGLTGICDVIYDVGLDVENYVISTCVCESYSFVGV